jgi:group I intron endonuclease
MVRKGCSKVAGVYAFQSITTGEIVYVGSSINISNRFYEHLNNKGSNIPLQNAFKKYGISAFNWLILVLEDYIFDWTISVKEILLALEQKYLDSLKPRYNLLRMRDLGYTHSAGTLKLLSDLAKRPPPLKVGDAGLLKAVPAPTLRGGG